MMIDVRHMKKLFLWMLLTAGCNPKKNVLSSEVGTQILQITQRTRYAQTAFRISLFRLRSAIRNSMLIQRICIPLKTSSCGMFSNVVSKHDAPCGNREALATEGTQECFREGGWGLAPIKTPRQGFDALSVP